jgi:hypothetical protein
MNEHISVPNVLHGFVNKKENLYVNIFMLLNVLHEFVNKKTWM